MATLRRGTLIRRLPRYPGGPTRLFRLLLVNKAVFSAESADDQWSGWGGPIAGLVEGKTFEFVRRSSTVASAALEGRVVPEGFARSAAAEKYLAERISPGASSGDPGE